VHGDVEGLDGIEVLAKPTRDFLTRYTADDLDGLTFILHIEKRVKGTAKIRILAPETTRIPEKIREVQLERFQPGILEAANLWKGLDGPLQSIGTHGINAERLRQGLVGRNRLIHQEPFRGGLWIVAEVGFVEVDDLRALHPALLKDGQ
jgi:hypothetical protein